MFVFDGRFAFERSVNDWNAWENNSGLTPSSLTLSKAIGWSSVVGKWSWGENGIPNDRQLIILRRSWVASFPLFTVTKSNWKSAATGYWDWTLTLRMLGQSLPQLVGGLECMLIGEIAFWCVTSDRLQNGKISVLLCVFLRRNVHLEAAGIRAVVWLLTHVIVVTRIHDFLLDHLRLDELWHHRIDRNWRHWHRVGSSVVWVRCFHSLYTQIHFFTTGSSFEVANRIILSLSKRKCFDEMRKIKHQQMISWGSFINNVTTKYFRRIFIDIVWTYLISLISMKIILNTKITWRNFQMTPN